MENIFYTYIYLDTRKPGSYQYGEYSFDYEPMYVGKGKNKRWEDHWNYYKNWLGYKIKHIKESGLEPKVIFQGKNLDEQSSLDLEMKLIATIGRRDLGTGPLVNFTDGGEGTSGYKFTEEMKKKMSENNPMKDPAVKEKHLERMRDPETRKKMSEKKMGENHPLFRKYHTAETKKKMSKSQSGENHPLYGKCHTEETKEKMSKKQMGKNNSFYRKQHTKESRKKISEGNKGKQYSEETKKKISESQMGKNNSFYGKQHTEESKKKMSREGKNNPMFGKQHTEESKKKMSETKKRNKELRKNK